ncbi:MAG: hypothetical protein IKR56_01130 [Lachnospiraceae bacterium]|nr:hypothetical protein [Lachnospiraceae bacterium]
MFKIENLRNDEDAKTLVLSDRLFHEALKGNPESKERFHVKNDKGEDFDIVYWDNDEDIENRDEYPAYVKPPYMSKYLVYDENDKDTLYLDLFDGLKNMMFEELNEYTIVISKVVLNFTDMEIWCADERISWFIDENPRLHIVEELPWDIYNNDDCFFIQEQMRVGMEDDNFNRLSNTYAFHNIFFLQWILNGRSLSQFKYMTLPVDGAGGIGALLSFCKRFEKAFTRFGLKFSAPDKEYFGRYPRKMVERYFALDLWAEDANEDNTVQVPNMVMLIKTAFIQKIPGTMDASVIGASFKAEMDEYFDAVFGGKKVLGVLIRGSDYISTGLSGTRKMATVEQMAPGIRKWMADYGYEKIFLATEDGDILKQMKDEFGRTMVALSQHRLTRADLKDGQIIADYEKKNAGDDYAEKLEDTTVNYFYALYLLSRCDAFMCSGQCNGWDTVISLNENRFERSYKYAVGINGDPRTEGWEEVGPVTAGMFTRGAYPTEKAFFMTHRFDLKEEVDPAAVKAAWEKTTKIYPYVTYATVVRRASLVLAKDPLPFVIRETAEVIEPSTPAANFHTVTICYLGNVLWVYADHVPFDGTGFMRVLETFFYHYYSITDECEYPVPEGVYTEKDGVVPEQDKDAYLDVDPIDPKETAGSFMNKPVFETPQSPKDCIFVPKADCRGFCISVPSAGFMEYAKSVKGSTMSVFYVLFAKALQRVNPGNTLPFNFMVPVSIRNVMGNENSLLHQVVHFNYNFDPKDLSEKTDEELNTNFCTAIAGFSNGDGIKMSAGVYRSICEGYAKAFKHGALNKIIMDMRKNMKAGAGVSYLGTMRTGEYGERIRMTAFHAMPEKGIMLQTTEVGGNFYIDWYQGFSGEEYVLAMRDILKECGISGIKVERTE